mgnify:CR=1 FL=1
MSIPRPSPPPPHQALRSLILDCLTPDVAAAARRPRAAAAAAAAAGPSPLSSLVAAVAGSLSSRYQDAWGMALPGEGGRWRNGGLGEGKWKRVLRGRFERGVLGD